MTDERRENDRRLEDQLLSERVDRLVEELNTLQSSFADGSIMLPNGKTALETVREHDDLFINQNKILEQQNKMIALLEGAPIVSEITGLPTGEHAPGALDKIDYLYQGVNGGSPVRYRREWTSAQRWAIGLAVTLMAGIFMTLLPIAITVLMP